MKRFSLFLVVVIVACLIVTGCTTNPPYRLDSGEKIVLTRGSGSVSCSYQELLNKIDSLLDNVLPHTKERSSGLDAMVMLHNGLEDMGIKTALVTINVQDNKPFYTCTAVETTDKGVVFLDIVPQSLGTSYNMSRSEYIQVVYVQKGKKIGFVEAKYAQSNSYSWYLEYLERFYYAADFAEYLTKYADVVDKNFERLGSIGKQLDEIQEGLERLRSGSSLFGLYRTTSDWEVYEFNRLVDIYNSKVDRFNQNIKIYEAQTDDYNAQVATWETLSEGLSESIYGIKEDLQYPFTIPLHPLVAPWSQATPPKFTIIGQGTIWASLSQVDARLNFDDSYYQLPKPDMQSVEPFERISEENFVVKNSKLWW